ncbi:MAG: SDR family oxidoreductase [Clostridia bacterium]|nr:SDR family oxidoreductase [Clostridia bacterium]
MNEHLSGKVALITGGAGTIGGATARVLARNGATVYVNDVDEKTGGKLESDIINSGGKARFIVGNVTNDADMKVFVQTALEERGKIDILVNNAGYNVGTEARKPVGDYLEADWNRVIDICLDGLYSCCKYTLPHMVERGDGCVVNIASVAGFRAPLRMQSPYGAAKAAILNLTQTMAIEYGRMGVRINAVIPGSIMNPQIQTIIYGTKAQADSMCSHLPIGMPGHGEDIANAVWFLVSPEARYITGSFLNVDGGWTSGYALP